MVNISVCNSSYCKVKQRKISLLQFPMRIYRNGKTGMGFNKQKGIIRNAYIAFGWLYILINTVSYLLHIWNLHDPNVCCSLVRTTNININQHKTQKPPFARNINIIGIRTNTYIGYIKMDARNSIAFANIAIYNINITHCLTVSQQAWHWIWRICLGVNMILISIVRVC